MSKILLKMLLMTAVLLAAVTVMAQATNFAINETSCGVYSNPNRCFYLSVTTLDADNQPTDPSGTVELSYKTDGYPVGFPTIFPDGTYQGRTVTDYGHIAFTGDLDGLAGQFNPPYPYQNAAAITAIDTDGSLLFQGVDDHGTIYYGRMTYTYTTYRPDRNCGRVACPTSWTITGGTISVQRVD